MKCSPITISLTNISSWPMSREIFSPGFMNICYSPMNYCAKWKSCFELLCKWKSCFQCYVMSALHLQIIALVEGTNDVMAYGIIIQLNWSMLRCAWSMGCLEYNSVREFHSHLMIRLVFSCRCHTSRERGTVHSETETMLCSFWLCTRST